MYCRDFYNMNNRHKQKLYMSTPLKILQNFFSKIPRFQERKKLFPPLLGTIISFKLVLYKKLLNPPMPLFLSGICP